MLSLTHSLTHTHIRRGKRVALGMLEKEKEKRRAGERERDGLYAFTVKRYA